MLIEVVRAMSKIDTIKRLWKKDKRGIFIAAYDNLIKTGFFNGFSDEAFLKLTYRVRFKRR